jgi:hypothetical protein
MPAATTILMGGATALQAIQGLAAQQKGQEAASKSAARIALLNKPVANQLSSVKVPMEGVNLAQQNIQTHQADALRVLQSAGAAGVLGGIPGVMQQSRAQNLDLSAQTADKIYERDMAVAQNQQRIIEDTRNRESELEQQRLLGAQNASAEGANMFSSALGSAAQIAGNVAIGKDMAALYGGGKQTLGDTAFGQSVSQYSSDLGKYKLPTFITPGLTSLRTS